MSTGKKAILILAVAFVCAFVAIVVWPGEKEPKYQGKKLSEWVSRGYNQNSRYETEQAAEAVRAIGTNALPFLLKWTENAAPRLHRTAFWIASRLPSGRVRDNISFFAFDDSNQRRADSAMFGFWALGSTGACTVPELTRMLQIRKDAVRFRAAKALAAIGKDGLSPLLAAAQDEHGWSRVTAVQGVCESQVPADSEEGRTVIQFALRCLKDKSFGVRSAAAGCMPARDFDVTVPALVEFLGHQDWKGRVGALATLERFGTNAHPAVLPTLIAATADSDLDVRMSATNVLERTAPLELEKLKGH